MKRRVHKINLVSIIMITFVLICLIFVSVGYASWVNNLKMDASFNTSSMNLVFKKSCNDGYRIDNKKLEIDMGSLENEKEYKYDICVKNLNNFSIGFDSYEVNSDIENIGEFNIEEDNYFKDISNLKLVFKTKDIENIKDNKFNLYLIFKNNDGKGLWKEKLNVVFNYELGKNKVEEDTFLENKESEIIDENYIIDEQITDETIDNNDNGSIEEITKSDSEIIEGQNTIEEGLSNDFKESKDTKDI